MQRVAISLQLAIFTLAAVGGCKPASTEPPGQSSDASDASQPGAPVAAPQTQAPTKPDGCSDVQDCTEQGTMAFLAGDPRGLDMLAYACVSDSPTACQNLSSALRSGAVPSNPPAAHAAALRGCKLGNPGACVDLGVDESLGEHGVTQDFMAARDHFEFACKAGVSKGCRYVGVLLFEGSLGSSDPAAALQWFALACEQSDPESCFNAGVLILDGVAGDVDLGLASAYMVRACELGDGEGCAAVDTIATAMQEQTEKVPGANLRVGSATVNGFTVESLECRVEGGGAGLMANMALLAALAERKTKIDKCGANGTVVEVGWTAMGGKISKAEGVGSEGACVAKVLEKLSTPIDGECAGMIVLGTAP